MEPTKPTEPVDLIGTAHALHEVVTDRLARAAAVINAAPLFQAWAAALEAEAAERRHARRDLLRQMARARRRLARRVRGRQVLLARR